MAFHGPCKDETNDEFNKQGFCALFQKAIMYDDTKRFYF